MNIECHFFSVHRTAVKGLAILAGLFQFNVALSDQCDCSEIVGSCTPFVEISDQSVSKEYDGRSVEYSFDLTVTVIPEETLCALVEFGIENKNRTAVSGFFDANRNYGQTQIYKEVFSGESIQINDTAVASIEDVYLIENKMYQSCKVCKVDAGEAQLSEEQGNSLDLTAIQDRIQNARKDADKDARDQFVRDSNVVTSKRNSNQFDARSRLGQFRSATDAQLIGLTGNLKGQLDAGAPLDQSGNGRDCDAVSAQHTPAISSLTSRARSGEEACALAPEIEKKFSAAKRDFANCTTDDVEARRTTISNLDAMIQWARETRLACSR